MKFSCTLIDDVDCELNDLVFWVHHEFILQYTARDNRIKNTNFVFMRIFYLNFTSLFTHRYGLSNSPEVVNAVDLKYIFVLRIHTPKNL